MTEGPRALRGPSVRAGLSVVSAVSPAVVAVVVAEVVSGGIVAGTCRGATECNPSATDLRIPTKKHVSGSADMPAKRRDLDRVVQWRRAQLVEAGFPRALAARVARDERYDLHTLIELVANGCAPALATSILEPIEQGDRRNVEHVRLRS